MALAPVAGAWVAPTTVEALLAEEAFDRINDERATRDLPALRWDPALAHPAADWSQHMATTDVFKHRSLADLWEAPWSLDYQGIAENIAYGSGGVERLHTALMRSDGHRLSILSPAFDAVGLGVTCDAKGRMWLTQNFGRSTGSSLPSISSVVTPPVDPIARADAGPSCDAATHPSPLPPPSLLHHPDTVLPAPGASEPTPEPLPAPAIACPEPATASTFHDITRSPHAPSISCVVWWGLASGTGPGTFDPDGRVTRGQMARFLTRLLDAAGVPLPAPTPQGFTDIADSVHRDAIDQLAALGVASGRTATEFAPSAPVRRDQMATFLVRAYELAAEATLSGPPAAFTDHQGSVHRQAIDKAAAAGFASGTSATSFSPDQVVRRDQMATFLARVLDPLVVDGLAAPPAA